MAYYQRIRDLREDCDKTQRELAEYFKTTIPYYRKYEQGKVEIPFERAIMLAKYYNVSLDYIAGLTNNKRGLSYGDLSREQKELFKLISELSPDESAKFIKLLKALINTAK